MKTGVILWWLPSAQKWTTVEAGAQAPSFFAFPPCVAQVSGDIFSFSYNRHNIKADGTIKISGVTTNSLSGSGDGVGNLGAPVHSQVTIYPQSIKIDGTFDGVFHEQYYQEATLQTEAESQQPYIEIEGSVMPFLFQRPLRLARA